MIPMIILSLCWVLLFPYLAAAQPLKELRIGSSDVTVSNLCTFYATNKGSESYEG